MKVSSLSKQGLKKDETKFEKLFVLNFRRKAAGRCGGGGNGTSKSGQP